ncbi:phage tail tube protein [uncultured Sphingomonas sp.]|uniref:phage tail tube protein n=1 Tax=uncultured Sphingomonas sp. TaxID=158754 RepID=UPI0025F9FAFC|nr:phage tail tube protein [uncultured Sphingomonas sp.]
MANNAMSSAGVTIRVKVGNGSFVKVGGVKTYSGLRGGSPAILDSTDLDSPAREKMLGLSDEGQFNFTANWIDADPGQAALIGARQSGAVVSYEVKFPSVTQVFKFDAFCQTAEISGGVDEIVSVSYGNEITGLVTRGTATA